VPSRVYGAPISACHIAQPSAPATAECRRREHEMKNSQTAPGGFAGSGLGRPDGRRGVWRRFTLGFGFDIDHGEITERASDGSEDRAGPQYLDLRASPICSTPMSGSLGLAVSRSPALDGCGPLLVAVS